MILFLHNRYRTPGGEERVVEDLAWLVRERLGEDAEVLERDSAALGRARATAGLLRGGLDPEEVAAAVRRSGARIVHAHNLTPALGWRALAAAREAGARTVLHLHNYRLVCAVGTCVDPAGADCTRCHGRDTRPGVRLNCRGSRAEAVAYGAALALWQRRLVALADVVVVPSAAARERLIVLGAPPAASTEAHVVGHVVRELADAPPPRPAQPSAIVASRLAREKGVEVAIDACALAGLPLTICGDGPLEAELRAHAARAGADVTFAGRVSAPELQRLRARASVALVPSRAAETFGLAALEAMAAGVPVAASRVGALAELAPDAALVAPGDARALADAALAVVADAGAPRRALAAARRRAAPDVVAPQLADVYERVARG
ncbi:MAG TPA: glycosyltransferase family 4 protein [Baekduia sp.]|uniref:glycosyltransferase family 4 protein n=1 Tax=Baekduia sp. TaxID=2600305 RepID=UPI002CC0CECF|nr:glycosyltransferase family 4 protein [Baekduia sp.]HMJ36466.1 glycosyltransferase family 4 protein [Baekduia sp.]